MPSQGREIDCPEEEGQVCAQQESQITMQITTKRVGNIRLTRTVILVLLCVLLFSAGCGRKTPPVPPDPPALPMIVSVLLETQNERVGISWELSEKDRRLYENVAGFFVYRADVSLLRADDRLYPDNFRQIASVPFRDNEAIPGRWYFIDSPPPGMAYYYKIRGFLRSGETGPDSETVSVLINVHDN